MMRVSENMQHSFIRKQRKYFLKINTKFREQIGEVEGVRKEERERE
jgi:hypothetical protein